MNDPGGNMMKADDGGGGGESIHFPNIQTPEIKASGNFGNTLQLQSQKAFSGLYSEEPVIYMNLRGSLEKMHYGYTFSKNEYLSAAEEYVYKKFAEDPVIQKAYGLTDRSEFEDMFIPRASQIIADSFSEIPKAYPDLHTKAKMEEDYIDFGTNILSGGSNCVTKQLFANKIMWENNIETYTLGGFITGGSEFNRLYHHDNVIKKSNGELVFQDIYSKNDVRIVSISDNIYNDWRYRLGTALNVWTWKGDQISQFENNPVPAPNIQKLSSMIIDTYVAKIKMKFQ